LSLALLLGGVNAACINFRPPPKPLAATLTGDAPTPVWTAHAGRRFTAPVKVQDNTLYVGSVDRKVYAVNLLNGEVRWSSGLPGIIAGGVLLAGDTVFAASSRPQGRVSALRRSDGKRIWKVGTAPIGAPLALISGVLIAQTQRGEVLGIDPQQGKLLWHRQVGVARIAAVATGEGGILVATIDSLFRLGVTDGRITHRVRSPGAIVSPWLGQNGALVAGTTDSQVVSIRPNDLRSNWSLRVDAPIFGAPAALGDTIYLASRTGTLYRVEPGSGEPVIKTLVALEWPVTSPVTISGRQILLGGADGVIRALRTDGTEIWRVRVWRPVELGPVPLSDGLLALGGNGDMHRFRR
jgi:outer membrane protein assembly factor BamB